jgi:hypothetical protein
LCRVITSSEGLSSDSWTAQALKGRNYKGTNKMKYKLIDWHKKRTLANNSELLPLWEQLDGYTKRYKAVVIVNDKNEIIAGNTEGYNYTVALGIVTL